LLTTDRDRGNIVDAAGCGDGLAKCGFPVGGIYLGAVRVFGRPLTHECARCGITDDHLARLRGGVNPRNERHVSARTHEVLDGKLLQANESVTLGPGGVDIEFGDGVVRNDVLPGLTAGEGWC